MRALMPAASVRRLPSSSEAAVHARYSMSQHDHSSVIARERDHGDTITFYVGILEQADDCCLAGCHSAPGAHGSTCVDDEYDESRRPTLAHLASPVRAFDDYGQPITSLS